mgnify:CR=1 FL=1
MNNHPDLPVSKTLDTLCKNLKKRGGMIQDEAITTIKHLQKELESFGGANAALNQEVARLKKHTDTLKSANTNHSKAAEKLHEEIAELKGKHLEDTLEEASNDVGGLDTFEATFHNTQTGQSGTIVFDSETLEIQ